MHAAAWSVQGLVGQTCTGPDTCSEHALNSVPVDSSLYTLLKFISIGMLNAERRLRPVVTSAISSSGGCRVHHDVTKRFKFTHFNEDSRCIARVRTVMLKHELPIIILAV
jgi:hypothetical protein